MNAYCQQTLGWIRSEAFNSINVRTPKMPSQNKNHGNREPKLEKVRTLPSECKWETCIFFSICLLILGSYFIKESTSSVSVKFTFKTSIIEMPAMLIIVAQDARFGEYIALS